MDGVVKRRHMKYASVCSLLNFKFRSATSFGTGSSEQFIRAFSLLFSSQQPSKELPKLSSCHSRSSYAYVWLVSERKFL